MEERKMNRENANLDVSRIVTLVGTSIAIFTFLLFFLYPRYISDTIDPTLFQISLIVIGFAIFSLVIAGLYFYIVTLPWPVTSNEAASLRRRGDKFWMLGYSVLLLEPSLILLTVNLPTVAIVWLALWISYLILQVYEYRKATRAKIR